MLQITVYLTLNVNEINKIQDIYNFVLIAFFCLYVPQSIQKPISNFTLAAKDQI